MPQTQFVFFFDNERYYGDKQAFQQNKKLSPFITEVVKFENLQKELNDLTDKYHMARITLPSENVQHPNANQTCKHLGLSIADLTCN